MGKIQGEETISAQAPLSLFGQGKPLDFNTGDEGRLPQSFDGLHLKAGIN